MSQIGTSIFFTISRKKIMFLRSSKAVFSALDISILDIFSSLGIWIPGICLICNFGFFIPGIRDFYFWERDFFVG